jgi:hypothetical protein
MFRPFMLSSSDHLIYREHADAIQMYLYGEDWYLSLLHKLILCFSFSKEFEGPLGVARPQQNGILARSSQWLYGLWKYSTDVLSTCMWHVVNCWPCAMNNNYFVCCVRHHFSVNPLTKNTKVLPLLVVFGPMLHILIHSRHRIRCVWSKRIAVYLEKQDMTLNYSVPDISVCTVMTSLLIHFESDKICYVTPWWRYWSCTCLVCTSRHVFSSADATAWCNVSQTEDDGFPFSKQNYITGYAIDVDTRRF